MLLVHAAIITQSAESYPECMFALVHTCFRNKILKCK